MSQHAQPSARWSDELGWRLLRGLDADQLASLAASAGVPVRSNSSVQLRADLLALARVKKTLRRHMMRRWRERHPAIVSAAGVISLEASLEDCDRLLSHFAVEEVVLELLTDERDGGWQLVEWLAEHAACPAARQALRAELKRLTDDDTVSPLPTGSRVVIFGGHPRDASKMQRRMFDGSGVDVRWKPCEKHQGSPDDKVLHESLRCADAAIVVTSMVSHNVMRIVKRYAQENGIRWKAIVKATDSQLRAALDELLM